MSSEGIIPFLYKEGYMWKKTDKDILLLSQIAKEITGCNFEHVERPAINCINSRMELLQLNDLVQYIDFALKNQDEFAHLVSSLTIHTTYWFREPKHFSILKKWIIEKIERNPSFKIRIWSAACSTGEEVYSLACVLESIRQQHERFDYSILGTDIDSISVYHARSAIYTDYDQDNFGDYGEFVEFKGDKSEFTLKSSILERCYFDVMSLQQPKIPPNTIDVVFIRNVLIYFTPPQTKRIISSISETLVEGGLLVTGMSESISNPKLLKMENTIYQKTSSSNLGSLKIFYFGKDKSFTKKYFSTSDHEFLEVVTTSHDEFLKNKLRELNPHCHVFFDLSDENFQKYLDILGTIKDNHCQVFLVYNTESVENHLSKAFKYQINFAGFINKAFVAKKSLSYGGDQSPHSKLKQPARPKAFKPKLIVLGASTGGVDALVHLLRGIGPDCPPIVVLQHINLYFSSPFVKRIAELANLKVSSCLENEVVLPGHLYSPTGNYNIRLSELGGKILR